MEFDGDLVGVQGILISVIKTTGEFVKIIYRGGNEEKIIKVIAEFQKFLTSKNYIKNNKPNDIFKNQLNAIVLFLALNTKYRNELEIEEYSHLINITPQLSKCLFINVVYGLDLCRNLCAALLKLPICANVELIEEVIPCLKKSVPQIHLNYAYEFLKCTADKLASTTDSMQEDYVDRLVDVTDIILINLTGLHSNHTSSMKTDDIYNHMGYSLERLFELLLHCDIRKPYLKRFIENVLRTCCTIMRNVTINVFCAWAEKTEDGKPLQLIVANTAYRVLEKYQKHSPAKELTSMLSTLAKKPKSVTELIWDADISTVIRNVDKRDENQSRWFQALVNTQCLQDADSLACLKRWSILCEEQHVVRLLQLSSNSNRDNREVRSVVVQCCANLSLKDLTSALCKHFYQVNFSNSLREDVEQQLTIVFNKMMDRNSPEITKEIVLIFAQNPVFVFGYLFKECLKNYFYSDCLKTTFESLRNIAKIDGIGFKSLNESISKNKPNDQNVKNFVGLFKILLEVSFFSNIELLKKVLFPVLEDFFIKKEYDELGCCLQIILDSNLKLPIVEEEEALIKTILEVMRECRCNFLEFSAVKHNVAKLVVDVICNSCEVNPNSDFKVQVTDEDDGFMIFYKGYLSSDVGSTLFGRLCPDFDINKYGAAVTIVLGVLQRCVTSEWLSIGGDMFKWLGCEKTTEVLTDVLILLCQLVKTQGDSQSSSLLPALKYNLQSYGLFLQKLQSNSEIQDEVFVTKTICRLLRILPESIKEEQGFSLINILTDRSLKFLSNDKEFVGLLMLINNPRICKTLAQIMTA